jgi:hypothetical protein
LQFIVSFRMAGLGTIGKQLIVLGLSIALVGVILILLGRFPWLKIGRLPGDIYVERDGWSFYFPLATSILLSVIISIILWLVRRKMNR